MKIGTLCAGRVSAASRYLARCAWLALACMTSTALADTWPARPVRLILPSAGGGGPDTIARIFAERLSRSLKQPVVVDNRPGANGVIGVDAVAKSAPDGYTLLFASSSSTVISQALLNKLPFEVTRDLVPVAQIFSGGIHLVVSNGFPAQDLKTFVALVKANPGKYDYATWGPGSTGQLVMESLKRRNGLDIRHVPYKTTSQIYQDMQGGRIQVAFVDATSSVPLIKNGKLRGIAITGSHRGPALPELQTMTEQGYPFDTDAWYGVFAPKGTPHSVVAAVHREILDTLSAPELRERFLQLNLVDPPLKTPEQFAQTVRADLLVWQNIARANQIHLD
ncbi:BUG/TctC family periplasmic protein (plasmid) [Cupriavidus necator H850]|uniref:Bug family tripartite tricarboxylate transporter substrate binding protein n=1 Tax=Cupriavidus necator TaxID=106590 RepID=UPI00129DC4B7|nr:tripartite tricarboxylate transporter substrate binding protein [Cupriavidus necator]KAI3601235.1 BUG/TctC family periplasmic protein [Cupriavidus necator H850]